MTDDRQRAPQNHGLQAHILAFITISIWGTTYISTKLLLESFSPTEIMFYRFVLAYAALLLIKPARIPYKNLKEEFLFIGAGFSGVVLYFTLQNTSLIYTLASNAGVLVSVAPFFTAILSFFILKEESLHKRFFIAFGLAIVGIILISFNGNFVLKLNPLGDILAIACAFAWAAYCIFMKKISALSYHVILCTRKIFFYGLLLMIPVLPFFDFQWGLSRFTVPSNILHMLFLGLGASALCFVTWNYAVGILGPVKTSVYIYFNPVVTVITSAIFLREKITPVAVLGIALILVGLVLSERKSIRNVDSQPEGGEDLCQ